ncbi:MAG: hypothetical protein HYV97_03155 [Bdellovibrio sp.]|nr:hypothetical protein [Bdellovibrio sp.]
MRLANIRHCLAVILAMLMTNTVYAYGIGISSFPLAAQKRMVSAEATGIMSHGAGAGIQARYTQNLNVGTTLDLGMGLSSGDRSSRVFAGMDYELFPDYEKQPRASIKATIANAREFGQTYNIFSVAPVFSKGFSFWGKEGHPYIAFPYGVSLNGDRKTYATKFDVAVGASAPLTFVEGYEKLIGNVEVTAGIKNSFTAIFMGVSYPIN